MFLSELLQEYREEHGLSQRQFAAKCGLSNGYISMLERGENPKTKLPVTPTLPALKKLADGMGMQLHELLVEVEDMPIEVLSAVTNELTEEMSALLKESGQTDNLDVEIVTLILQLSPEKKREALSYLRYLAERKDS